MTKVIGVNKWTLEEIVIKEFQNEEDAEKYCVRHEWIYDDGNKTYWMEIRD